MSCELNIYNARLCTDIEGVLPSFYLKEFFTNIECSVNIVGSTSFQCLGSFDHFHDSSHTYCTNHVSGQGNSSFNEGVLFQMRGSMSDAIVRVSDDIKENFILGSSNAAACFYDNTDYHNSELHLILKASEPLNANLFPEGSLSIFFQGLGPDNMAHSVFVRADSIVFDDPCLVLQIDLYGHGITPRDLVIDFLEPELDIIILGLTTVIDAFDS